MTRAAAHGFFCWYELMTKDPDGAKAFYTDVIGWTVQNMEMPGMDYAMLHYADQPCAGLAQLPPQAEAMGAPTHWLAYVTVTDVAETVADAVKRGATVYVEAQPVPGVGTFAILTDPWGAAFAVLQPESGAMDVPPRATHGGFTWNELYASDLEAAQAFYVALFGWEVQGDMDMGEMGSYRVLGLGERQFVGMMNRPPQMPVSAWLSYTHVDDLPAAVERAKAAGGQLMMGPHQVPGGDWIAHMVDPQGGAFALHALAKTP